MLPASGLDLHRASSVATPRQRRQCPPTETLPGSFPPPSRTAMLSSRGTPWLRMRPDAPRSGWDSRHGAPRALPESAGRAISDHGARPVFTSEEAARVRGTPIESGAKALVFLAGPARPRGAPRRRRVDNARLRAVLGSRTLRFATQAELLALTGCVPGALPPFGNLFGLPRSWTRRWRSARRSRSARAAIPCRSSCAATTSSASRRPVYTRSAPSRPWV